MNSRTILVTCLSSLFLASSLSAQVAHGVDRGELRRLSGPIASGDRVALRRVPVGDSLRTLDLERFEVWAPNAKLVVDHADGSRTEMTPPPIRYFRGTVEGAPDSFVVLSMTNEGVVDGLVVSDDIRYKVRTEDDRSVTVTEASPLDDYPIDGSLSCQVGRFPLRRGNALPRVQTDAAVVSNGVLSATGSWTLHLAVETDYELYQDMGSSPATVNTFIGNVIAAVSTIYRRDLSTDVLIAFSRVQASAADPFNVVPGTSGTWDSAPVTYSSMHALLELGDLWANAGTRPYSGPRSSVILMSGKSQTAGIAWVGTACGGDFSYSGHTGGAYAYIGLGNPSTTVPNPDATVNGVTYGTPSSNYWPVLGVAHELGHNVDGDHTHCISLSAAQKTAYNVTRNFVDECYSGEAGNGCSGAAQTVPAERGTVMSYCHLRGTTQSRFLFGVDGQPSELSKNQIRTFINSRTPASPSISAPASLGAGASANASINSPVGGLTYQWTITNGTINGASTGTTVNFTATTNPVTLRVRGTNASGCAASDYVNVTVNSCVAPAVPTVAASALSLTTGSSAELTAQSASGSLPMTFEWFRGATGDTSNPVGTGAAITVSPGSTSQYWVRAVNACNSVPSAAITLTVIAPPGVVSASYTLTPCRVIDTRDSTALTSGATRVVQIAGVCGVPANAKAVFANITAVMPEANGFLAVYPQGAVWTGTMTTSYRTGKTRASSAILALSGSGQAVVLNQGGTQHFIIDVSAYFE